jgi:glucose/arabinose dehydrogenase
MNTPAKASTRQLIFYLLVSLAVYWLGWLVEPGLESLPGPTLGSRENAGSAALGLEMLPWYVGWHVLFLLLFARGASVTGSPIRGLLLSVYIGLAATALTALTVFVSGMTFVTHYFMAVFVLYGAVYLAALVVASRGNPRVALGEIRKSFFTPAFAAAMASGLAIVCLLGMYFLNMDVRNAFNAFRAGSSVELAGSWELKDYVDGLRLDRPMAICFSPVEPEVFYALTRAGQILRVGRDKNSAELMLDFSARVSDTEIENGALDLALHPLFGSTGASQAGYVFVNYTGVSDENPLQRVLRLSRFDLAPATSEQRAATETVLIEQTSDSDGHHNGGTVLFGSDGMLYLSIGDLGDSDNGQDRSMALAAGVIRIDVNQTGHDVSKPIGLQPERGTTANYYVPLDNPFVGEEGVLEEYWAVGLRNPFRMEYDPVLSAIWAGDVGSNLEEEINLLRAGSNGQWPYIEGLVQVLPHDGKYVGRITVPFHHYRQTGVMRAIIGGIPYRGARFPELVGQYVFADNQAGVLFSLDLEAPERGHRSLARVTQVASYGITSLTEAPDGQILITTLGSARRPSGRVLTLGRKESQENELNERVSALELYESLCSRCHGLDGKGGPATAQLAARPDFTDALWQKRTSSDRIAAIISRGGSEMGLSASMPSWRETLTDEEIGLLVSYIMSLGESKSTLAVPEEE